MAVITLTTEWRPDDIYNGIIKGKLCNMCPQAAIVDNACNIPPFNISQASFIIRNTYLNYPKGSIHIICVHSEAHKGEHCLIVKARDHFFIGTDNGIFNLILNSEPDEIVRVEDDGTTDELEIFAKVASELFNGKKPSQLGTKINAVTERLPLRATIDREVIIGSIIFIDSYGNAISNITKEIFYRIFENREFRISVQSNKNYTGTISRTYSDVPVGELLAKFNQLDLLEVSINGANISELLSIEVGSSIRIDLISKTAPSDKLF
ncbi:MAG: SAM-dependent chlorinase/fluorinase [Bacteroidota bacterium]|nr:SAM-dependent chlorinase/fluorinase [Bacteroidota bacterium]